MATQSTKTLSFGDFALDMRVSSTNRDRVLYTLRKGRAVIDTLEHRQLEILAYLADRVAGQDVSAKRIYQTFWSGAKDSGGNVQHHISKIRSALQDSKTEPRYIETLPNDEGYRFKAAVKKSGDLGFLDGFLQWSNRHYHQMLESVEVGDDSEDIRITNMAFMAIGDLGLEELLQRGVRIRILLTNPTNKALVEGRASLREDKPPEVYKQLILDNMKDLDTIAKIGYAGQIEYRLSDIMPSSYLTHTKQWAIMGLFLAHTAYFNGPMIEVPSGSRLYSVLRDEWQRSWEIGEEPKR